MSTNYPTSWTENADEIRRLREINAELVAVLAEAEQNLSYILAGEDHHPSRWAIPGSALREVVVKHARSALARAKGEQS